MSNTSLQSIVLHPWVYVLRCKPRDGTNYPTLYVGATLNCHLAQNPLLQSCPKLSWLGSCAALLRYSCAPILASAAPCTACDAPVAHGHLQRLSALLRTARHR